MITDLKKAIHFVGYEKLAEKIGDTTASLKLKLNGYVKYTPEYEDKIIVALLELGVLLRMRKLSSTLSRRLANVNK